MLPSKTGGSLRTRRFPLLGAAIMFGSGIMVGVFFDYRWPWLFGGLAVLIVLLSQALSVLGRGKQKTRELTGYLLLVSLFILGIWRVGVFHPSHQSNYFGHWLLEEDNSALNQLRTATSLVKVQEIKASDRGIRLVTEVLGVEKENALQESSGKLLVYLPFSKSATELLVGDQLMVHGEIDVVSGPKNPYAFDAQKYWASKNVFARVYVKNEDDWRAVPLEGMSIYRFADQLRRGWQNSLKLCLKGDELAVASALLLGKKDLLNQNVRNAYADTGAIHVLAVSGLHVGIVNLLLGFLLGGLAKRGKAWKALQLICTLLGIWFFALLTGFSPSVQRAALMFSFVAVGQMSQRKGHLLNSLAAAGICILAVDPQQLFQPGFQLSFAAVTGIGLFQKWINGWLRTEARPIRWVWSAMSVSVAATLGTLPFSLFYFHQFPLYFMFTGSLVVLTAFVIMILGMVHGALYLLVPAAAFISGPLLSLAVAAQNGIVFLGRQLPGARQETMWLNTSQLWLLLLAIILLGVWLRSRRFGWAMGGSLAMLAFLSFWLRSSKALNEQQLAIAYSIRTGAVVDIVNGHHATRFVQGEQEPIALSFATTGYQSAKQFILDTTIVLENESDAYRTDYISFYPPFLQASSGSWLFLNQSSYIQEPERVQDIPSLDFIVADNHRFQPSILQTSLVGDQTKFITNSYYKSRPLLMGSVANLPPFNTAEQGAFEVEVEPRD